MYSIGTVVNQAIRDYSEACSWRINILNGQTKAVEVRQSELFCSIRKLSKHFGL
jgi:hypothetical protein